LKPGRATSRAKRLARAERQSVPIFRICRGLQSINVFAGGSLLQDVPSHAGRPMGRARPHPQHEVDSDSRLGGLSRKALRMAWPRRTRRHDHRIDGQHQPSGRRPARLAPGLRAVAGRPARPAAWSRHWRSRRRGSSRCSATRNGPSPHPHEFEASGTFVRAAREATAESVAEPVARPSQSRDRLSPRRR